MGVLSGRALVPTVVKRAYSKPGLGHRALCRSFGVTAKDAFVTEEDRQRICRELGVDESRVMLSIKELRKWRTGLEKDQSVGFVPTMGALHEGHLSLLGTSKKENDLTLSSIFVNPAQFAPHEDFSKYPRQADRDLRLMFEHGADRVFVPHQADMYPGSEFGQTSTSVTKTHVVPDNIDSVSEGAARPGFFRGVATVVCKLLNLTQATNLYLGQKDGLQVIVVRRMVRDLNIPTVVRPCDTIRESDGLAMSSRNVYLSEEQRRAAPVLYKALSATKDAYNAGERSYTALKATGQQILDQEPLFRTEYLSICDSLEGHELGEDVELSDSNIMVSAAVSFENCRILDNVLLGVQK